MLGFQPPSDGLIIASIKWRCKKEADLDDPEDHDYDKSRDAPVKTSGCLIAHRE
jgi:hypothetical protein